MQSPQRPHFIGTHCYSAVYGSWSPEEGAEDVLLCEGPVREEEVDEGEGEPRWQEEGEEEEHYCRE